MGAAPLPRNEAERLAVLRSYEVLDSLCESSFDQIVELATMLTGSPISLVCLVDVERQWFKAHAGLDVSETPRACSFCAHAILDPAAPLIVRDATKDPRFADNPLVTGPPGIRFYAGVPLVAPEGTALGTLCIIDRQPRDFGEREHFIMTRLAGCVMTALELRRALLRVRQVATLDSLTGLPNRPALIDALSLAIAQCEQTGAGFSLLYIDCDGFKAVNDQHGHAVGDAVLCEVASALQTVTRAQDFVARLAGDEFALLIAGDRACAEAAATRLMAELGSRMRRDGWPVTVSIGAACFDTAPASVDEALAAADALMYRAKSAGKDRLVCNTVGGARANALPPAAAADA
jgi:diguanylate cyclase (GGDEF)-like protein